MIAQLPEPGDQRYGVEAELRDDLHAEAGLLRGLELGGEQTIEFVWRDAGMAVGIARDADLDDAAARDQTGIDRLQRAMERPGRLGAITSKQSAGSPPVMTCPTVACSSAWL